MTVAGVLELVREVRLGVPVVLMTYLNPVLAYGLERFLGAAHDAGAAGLLLTDCPAGCDPLLERTVAASPLALIRLVAPTTSPERLAVAVQNGTARGFVYFISRLGVTGARVDVPSDLAPHVARIRAATPLPVAVGFGIGTAAQVEATARVADGVVVGSALVEALGSGGLAATERLLTDLVAAVRRVRRGEQRAG
jgi:tryptophan synthase alpha chain